MCNGSSLEHFLTNKDALFRAVVEQSSVAVWVADLEGSLRYLSPSWSSMFNGAPVEDYIGKNYTELLHPDDVERCYLIFADVVQNQTNFTGVEYRVLLPDGGEAWHTSSVSPLLDQERQIRAVTGTCYIIHDRKVLEERVRISEERYQLLADNAFDTYWTIGADGQITYVSPMVEKVRGLTAEEAKAQPFDQIHPASSLAKVSAWLEETGRSISEGRKPNNFRGELEYYRKDGSIFWSEVIACPILNADGSLSQIAGVSRDISDRKKYEEDLESMNVRLAEVSMKDPLTGASNRRHFTELLNAEIAKQQRKGATFCLIMFDIDHFKEINDLFGHTVGDNVLVAITKETKKSLRPSACIARLGGEEFAVLVPECALSEGAAIAERLRREIESYDFPVVHRVTASYGVVESRSNETEDQLMKRVDDAMYISKKLGRNTVTVSK